MIYSGAVHLLRYAKKRLFRPPPPSSLCHKISMKKNFLCLNCFYMDAIYKWTQSSNKFFQFFSDNIKIFIQNTWILMKCFFRLLEAQDAIYWNTKATSIYKNSSYVYSIFPISQWWCLFFYKQRSIWLLAKYCLCISM